MHTQMFAHSSLTPVTQLTQTLTPEADGTGAVPTLPHRELHTLTQAPTWSMPTARYPCECPIPTHTGSCVLRMTQWDLWSHMAGPVSPVQAPASVDVPLVQASSFLRRCAVCPLWTAGRTQSTAPALTLSLGTGPGGMVGAWGLDAHPSPHSWGSGRNSRKGRVD